MTQPTLKRLLNGERLTIPPKPEPGKPYARDDLFDADPACQHRVISANGGGIKCLKCPGWFCY